METLTREENKARVQWRRECFLCSGSSTQNEKIAWKAEMGGWWCWWARVLLLGEWQVQERCLATNCRVTYS